MLVKSFDVKIKAGPEHGLDDGQFLTYTSKFNNKDSGGDVVRPGTFLDDIADWAKSGYPMPVLYGHNLADPDYNIGQVLESTEDEKGWLNLSELDFESPKAPQTYRLLKSGRIRQMSYGYDVLDGSMKEDSEHGRYFEIRKAKVYEISVVPIGMNQETEVLAVKSAAEALVSQVNPAFFSMSDIRGDAWPALKAGRVLSAKNLSALKSARDAIDSVLAAGEPVDDQEKTSAPAPAKDEEPAEVKSEEPADPASVDDLATRIRYLTLKGARA